MIRFLYRANSDKTRTLLIDSIRADLEAGGKAILLVPEQETVSAERRMLNALHPSAQLSFEVLNFSRLANRVFRTVGGLSYRAASPAISALLMWRALVELSPLLTQYNTSAVKDTALCELMMQTEAQCKASCVSADDLLQAAEALPEGEPLRDKLTDIGLTLSTFEQRLSERFDNAEDELSRLAAILSKEGKSLFGDAHIYIDSFTDFTVQELAVLRALFAAAPSVSVTFPLKSPRETGIHLTSVIDSHKKLLRMARELSLRVFFEEGDDMQPDTALSYLSHHLFDMTAEPAPLLMNGSGDITLCECASPFEEAAAAAATIQRLLRDGCRYRDITVVVRDANAWNGILDAALEKEDIPYFISEKRDITVYPLIKLILGALRIKLRGWRDEDVMGYLKTGLCGIDADDVNLFEEYVNVWHPRGEKAYTGADFSKNPDGYAVRISDRGARILEGANRVRQAMLAPLLAFFEAMDKAKDATGLCRALYQFLTDLHIPEALKAQASERLQAGERREAQELSRLYGITVDAMEEISNAIGDKHLTVAEFADALKLVFARTDIGTIPTSADEVTIGSASMLRADHPRFVLILGLNEGVFPQTVSNDGLFGDAEKKKLAELGVEFPSDSAKLASDELFYLYRAASAPREGLHLYYATTTTDGKALSPSIAIDRLKALFPKLEKRLFAAEDPIDRIFTPAGAMEALTELPQNTKNAVLELLLQNGVVAANGLQRPVVDPNACVSKKTADRLFASGRFNPTHLESFSSCRFAYYCSKVLRLREEPGDSMSSAGVGNFIHHILEHIMLTVQREKLPFSAYGDEKQAQMVRDICEKYRLELEGAGGELTPRTSALLARLGELAKLIVSGLFAEFSDSLFAPAFLELDLNAIGERPAVTLKSGTEIPLSGKADRVDFWKDEKGRAYLRVADYKTGTRSFDKEDIAKGFCLQMPLYLLALCRGNHKELCRRLNIPEDTVFHPAGVSYLSSAIGTENTESRRPEKDAMKDAVDRLSREGLVLADAEVQHAMSLSGNKAILGDGRSKSKQALSAEEFDDLFLTLENTIADIATCMKKGEAEAHPHPHGTRTPCEYCAFSAVCRAAQKK